jgi:flagellar basal body-associated protein FliL
MVAKEHTDPQKIIGEIRWTLRFLVVATVVLFFALGGVGYFAWHVSDQNRQAVCNLRGDLQHRVRASEDFISEHPQAIARLGLSLAQVQKEIINQQHTLAALSVVSC